MAKTTLTVTCECTEGTTWQQQIINEKDIKKTPEVIDNAHTWTQEFIKQWNQMNHPRNIAALQITDEDNNPIVIVQKDD
jgi:uncharacterized membrane protein